MSSTLGNNILDQLIPVIDDIRGSVNDQVGIRQWKVYLVKRVWPSGRRGDRSAGPPVITSTELVPSPKVTFAGNSSGTYFELQQQGKHEEGLVKIEEVSLQYSEDQLSPQNLPADTEFYYRFADKLGQLIPNRYYKPAGPPAPDREETIGWTITLKRTEIIE